MDNATETKANEIRDIVLSMKSALSGLNADNWRQHLPTLKECQSNLDQALAGFNTWKTFDRTTASKVEALQDTLQFAVVDAAERLEVVEFNINNPAKNAKCTTAQDSIDWFCELTAEMFEYVNGLIADVLALAEFAPAPTKKFQPLTPAQVKALEYPITPEKQAELLAEGKRAKAMDTDNETKEILNRNFGGSIFPTIASAAVACIVDNLTAGGIQSSSDALYTADQAGAPHIIAEIADNFDYDVDQIQELMDSWDDALDQLYEWRMHGVC